MTIKGMNEKVGDLRLAKVNLTKERASKMEALEAVENDFSDEGKEKYDILTNEISEINEKIARKEKAIENTLEQITLEQEKPAPDDTFETFVDSFRHTDKPKTEKGKEKSLYGATAGIFTTLANRGMSQAAKLDKIGDLQKQLFKGGHYDNYVNSVDGFNTLTDSDGGVFLPTTISDRIFDIAEENGVFSMRGERFPMSPGDGRQIVPNLLGELTFYAVNEGSEAKASKLTFSAIVLEEQKWMTYIPWTNEMDDLQGQRLVQIVLRKLGEALARMRDNAIVNADGSSSFHNLKGFVNRSADSEFKEVRESTAATGNNSFASIQPDDFLAATLDIAKSIRGKMRIALDPDWRVYLKQMKDNDGIPYYKNGSGVVAVDGEQYMVHGIPVDFTEAIPSADGAGKPYGVGYVPQYFAFADNGRFVIEQFNTGQIPDTEGNSNAINLLSQDMKAARVKTFFDFELSQITKTYDGVSYGAFTVLKTAT